jgi:MoxR-like ATPase
MTDVDIAGVNAAVERESDFFQKIFAETGKVMVGQTFLMERLLIGILANGHLLLEGVPGLAKTTAVRALSSAVKAQFQRIQFTPDMLPADLTGTMIYEQKSGAFTMRHGPLFANLILADEINRAPAKVQSALLEAMQERQVTIGGQTYPLPDPFLVLATQNPIEQEGTYPLPEAQVDRFMLKIHMTYPDKNEELEILRRMAMIRARWDINPVMEPEDMLRLRGLVDRIYMDEKIERYIVDIVDATRRPREYQVPECQALIQFGASPRATINLAMAARARALLRGRGYVTPEDIKSLAPDVLRHRIILTYEAEAEEKTTDDVIRQLLAKIPIP